MPKQFFPSSDRPELLVDLRLPEGASFAATLRETKRFEAAIQGRKEIASYVSFVGSGAPRFYLPLDQQLTQPNFAQFVITAKESRAASSWRVLAHGMLAQDFSAVRTASAAWRTGRQWAFRCSSACDGDDIATVRGIAEQVADDNAPPTPHRQRAVRLG